MKKNIEILLSNKTIEVHFNKELKNHKIIQTIARANRVFPGKDSGLIVSYINLFQNLQKAVEMWCSYISIY